MLEQAKIITLQSKLFRCMDLSIEITMQIMYTCFVEVSGRFPDILFCMFLRVTYWF